MDRKNLLLSAAVAALTMAAGCDKIKSMVGGQSAKADAAGQGHCFGLNACKGQGACASEGHSCAGQNSCKGKGWWLMSKQECDAKKGDFKAI